MLFPPKSEKDTCMFFGRDSELDRLASLWRKRVSSLVTCRGRRRVGKSALVEEFAKRPDAGPT